MIELRHMDVRHLVIIEYSHLANGCTIKMWLHRFDVISLYIMLGRNNVRYKYYMICFGICMQSLLPVESCATIH